MWILIPSYEPGERLLELISSLREHASILVVDDGSWPEFRDIFEAADRLGAVVCADSDGQHLPQDVLAVPLVIAKITADAAFGTDYS